MRAMKKYIFSLIAVSVLVSCEDFLEEEVFTEYDPAVFLQDQSGLDALLTGAYGSLQISWTNGGGAREYFHILGEMSTDILWETGGGLNRVVVPVIGFTWDPSNGFFNQLYNKFYTAIAAANNVLSVTNNLEGGDEAVLNQIRGEARFVRALSYYLLHNLYGTTPIIELPDDAGLDEIEAIGKETPRATESEYRTLVEGDLLFAVNNLEFGGVSSRANRGSANAILAKFYLNNKEWDKAAAAAEEVLTNGGYELCNDYNMMFSIDGESNNEYIFRFECLLGSAQRNVYMPHAFPPNFPIQSNWANFGAQFRTYTAFYETFEPGDERTESFLTEYTPTTTGELTPLVRDADGVALDNVRSFKYVPDPGAAGTNNGNDIPYVRLADIMLARAEALNEINGPNQKSIDLINQIRGRAAASIISLTDFPTTEALRNFILAERGREFFTEGLRREDLVRHGKFIDQAVARGIAAQAHQVLYPLPEAQLDNNPNLEQNPGY